LTPKQRVFISEYIVDHNATRAAITAGYSKKTAQEQGSRLLSNVIVAAAIKSAQQASLQRTETVADEILNDLNALRKCSLVDILADDFTLKPPSEWGDTWLRLKIAGIEVEQKMVRSTDGVQAGASRGWDASDTRVIKIKFVDPIKSIQLLGTHVGVRAFVNPFDKLGDGLSDLAGSIDRAIAEGRQRAAQRNRRIEVESNSGGNRD